MKANNLTISVPNHGCDKNCPYCISHITDSVNNDLTLMLRNMPKVRNFARRANVSSVLITCKGETLLNIDDTMKFINEFRHYPVELQTNGIWLSKNTEMIKALHGTGLDIIAVSVDSKPNLSELSHMFRIIKAEGLLLRICFNFTDIVLEENFAAFMKYYFGGYPIDQVLIRNIGYPKNKSVKTNAYTDWIDKHNAQGRYNTFYEQIRNDFTSPLIRTLAHGAQIYDINGVAVCFSDYCVQEAHNEEDIRSLILLEDGHLYTSWSSGASKLF